MHRILKNKTKEPQNTQRTTHAPMSMHCQVSSKRMSVGETKRNTHVLRGRMLILYPTIRAKINLTTFRQP